MIHNSNNLEIKFENDLHTVQGNVYKGKPMTLRNYQIQNVMTMLRESKEGSSYNPHTFKAKVDVANMPGSLKAAIKAAFRSNFSSTETTQGSSSNPFQGYKQNSDFMGHFQVPGVKVSFKVDYDDVQGVYTLLKEYAVFRDMYDELEKKYFIFDGFNHGEELIVGEKNKSTFNDGVCLCVVQDAINQEKEYSPAIKEQVGKIINAELYGYIDDRNELEEAKIVLNRIQGLAISEDCKQLILDLYDKIML